MRQGFVITSLMIVLSTIPAYKLKTKLGVDLLPGAHAPLLVEKYTGGLVKARWIKRNYIRRPQLHQSIFHG